MKQIAYIATDSGMEGEGPTVILYASFDEAERDSMVDADKSKAWRTKSEVIVDVASARRQALTKLNGLDRLVLGLKPWPDNT